VAGVLDLFSSVLAFFMTNDFLNTIVTKKRVLIASRRAYYENLRSHLVKSAYSRYGVFKKSISRPGEIALVAEIKKASPSKGVLRDDFNVAEIARAYEQAGASALSVLTEEEFFQGKPAYLKQVSETIHLPTLMKDFFIDELQLYEARYCGASAVLLIVAILDDEQLGFLLHSAHGLDLDCLVEVHDEAELKRALKAGADILGVNNRDLRSFDTSLGVAEKLIPMIPDDKVIVAESGIRSYQDVMRLKELGTDAVLIGEAFMKERDIVSKVKEVMTGK
jgi:indole-3-glycerol phosphate synthase